MLTRVSLAAGVAALAIAAPVIAGPHGGGGGGGNPHGNGGGAPQAAAQGGGGGGGGHGHGGGAPQAAAQGGGGGGGRGHGGGGGGQAPMSMGNGGGHGHGGGGQADFGRGGHGHGGGGFAAPRQQARAFSGGGGGHGHGQQARTFASGGGGRGHGQQARALASGGGGRGHGQQAGAFANNGGVGRGHGQQARALANNGGGRGQQARGIAQQQADGFQRQQAQMVQGQQLRGNGNGKGGQRAFAGQQFRGAISGQSFGGQRMNGKAAQVASQQFVDQNANRYAALSYANNRQVLPATEVAQFVGQPIGAVPAYASLSPLPTTLDYLYPATSDYYYQYGGGYLYQVDRTDNLIAALIPLLAGGYLPGQYLPQAYMGSYAPASYGYDAFYPADYGYNNLCNRYEYGVVYQVDCDSGMVENVIPVYAGGYGVGQLLPTAYTTYNVPAQYRRMYYNSDNAGYWYAPGAIYQYDPRSSVITSVATLMSPGFSIGQPLPFGYGAYNVPYDYRATYYDTPTAWYRYNNGYIYQVDPTTQLVTAIVASLLT
jgi:hypothetical protein